MTLLGLRARASVERIRIAHYQRVEEKRRLEFQRQQECLDRLREGSRGIFGGVRGRNYA